MHKIQENEFTLEDFSCEHLTNFCLSQLKDTIHELERLREYYIHWDTVHYSVKEAEGWTDKKDLWYQMIQLLPSCYNQTRNVQLNYEVLANIYKSRKDHKLDEWREFCKWIFNLPFYHLITDCQSSANLKKAIPAICLDMINKETEKMLPRQTTCIDSEFIVEEQLKKWRENDSEVRIFKED